jgi:hypothetical protein
VAAREIFVWSGLALRETIIWGTLAACVVAGRLFLVPEPSPLRAYDMAASGTASEPVSTGSLAKPHKASAWQDPLYEREGPSISEQVGPSASTTAPIASVPVQRPVAPPRKPRSKRTPRPIDLMQWSLP